MADDKNFDGMFTVGAAIKCRFQGDDVEGHIAAFSAADRLLMIKSPAASGKSSNFDYILINADCLDVVSLESNNVSETFKPLDFQKLEKRRVKSLQTKKTKILALAADVSAEARKLFLYIMKTIEEIGWEGDKIFVLNEVHISPPYKPENVQGDKEASLSHVKKIVDKYWKEQSPVDGTTS